MDRENFGKIKEDNLKTILNYIKSNISKSNSKQTKKNIYEKYSLPSIYFQPSLVKILSIIPSRRQKGKGKFIKEIYNLISLEGLGTNSNVEIIAIGSILQYLKDTHRKTFNHLKIPEHFLPDLTARGNNYKLIIACVRLFNNVNQATYKPI